MLANALLSSERTQVLVDALTVGLSNLPRLRSDNPVGEPSVDITDTALTRLVAEEALDDAAIDDATHPGHLRERRIADDVTRRRPHDGDELAGSDGLRGRSGDVRVDVADRDCNASGQA